MKEKKLQVFVSSTFEDLKEERQAAVEAILASGNIPAGMELYTAGDESQMIVIQRWIDESDVYLLILGGRYGSVDKKTGKSYTQLEFEYAIKKKKPLFAIVISEIGLKEKLKTLDLKQVIENDRPIELKSFRSKVLKHLVKFWDDKKDIQLSIHNTLSDFSYRKELSGWVRGDNVANASILAEEIARVTKENLDLKEELLKMKSNTGDTVFYSGLSYKQLKQLIQKENIEMNSETYNLFEFIKDNGQHLIKGIKQVATNENLVASLKKYRFVEDGVVTLVNDRFRGYLFTKDGHDFYLRILAEEE